MLNENYRWEAEKQDGSVVTEGENLSDVVRFSLIPTNAELPQHDVVGIKLERRFSRGFINVMGGNLREYVHCLVAEDFRMYIKSSNGVVLITPKDYELYL